MAGGLLQLCFYGAQNVLLMSNPNVSFFKKVFKTHTNFSMESISLPLNRTDCNIYESTQYTVKIDRHGDLINYMYFVLELPDIISDDILNFKWVEDLAESLIDNYYITINGSIIETNYGENMYIRKNLGQSGDRKIVYDNMTGNTDEFNNPSKWVLDNTNISDIPLRYRIGSTYPTANINPLTGQVRGITISSRKIYIPLNFWFNRDVGNSLPLIALQYSDTYLNLELKPFYYIYKLLYNKAGIYDYYAPDIYNTSHRLINFVTNANQNFLLSDTNLDIKAYLEVNYVFLDTLERTYFAYKPLEYLIEQNTRVTYDSVAQNAVLELVLQNPVKEIIWVLKRSDLFLNNKWFDFQDKMRHILIDAKILMNGVERITEKDPQYFNYVQAYQHHTTCRKNGIYMYSFSLSPEDSSPTGSCNMSRVNKLQFPMTIRLPDDSSYTYSITFYVVNNNFLKIQSGLCGIEFSL